MTNSSLLLAGRKSQSSIFFQLHCITACHPCISMWWHDNMVKGNSQIWMMSWFYEDNTDVNCDSKSKFVLFVLWPAMQRHEGHYSQCSAGKIVQHRCASLADYQWAKLYLKLCNIAMNCASQQGSNVQNYCLKLCKIV